ncbi:DUF2190 family protein [Ralstonia pseudosolanacearum]|nr:DUF2190 family protein [Ralstonia pseudosolanacearum]
MEGQTVSQQANAIFTITVKAAAAIAAQTFVSPSGGVPAAGANTIGVAKTDAAVGDALAVDTLGTAVVVAGAAIPAGSAIEVDAAGRALPQNAGKTVGRLKPSQSAAALGDLVEVILIPN